MGRRVNFHQNIVMPKLLIVVCRAFKVRGPSLAQGNVRYHGSTAGHPVLPIFCSSPVGERHEPGHAPAYLLARSLVQQDEPA